MIHDTAMNFALNSALEPGGVARLTRQVAYVESQVRDADGDMVFKASGTFLVRRQER